MDDLSILPQSVQRRILELALDPRSKASTADAAPRAAAGGQLQLQGGACIVDGFIGEAEAQVRLDGSASQAGAAAWACARDLSPPPLLP
jgi:hypothetical protein